MNSESPSIFSRLLPTRAAAAMLLVVVGVGLLLFHGRLSSSDEVLMVRQAFAIGREARLTFPELYGRTHSQYGLLTALQGVPWVWAESGLRAWGWGPPDPAITLLPLANLLNSLLLALYFRALGRRLGASDAAASTAGALLILATPFLPYSQSFFSETATAVVLLAAAVHLGLGREDERGQGRERADASPDGGGLGDENASRDDGGLGRPTTTPDGTGARGEGFRMDPVTRRLLIAGGWIAAGLHLRVITVAVWPLWAALAWRNALARGRTPREALGELSRLFIPPGVAVVVLLILNAILRGHALHAGYETSAFTTPLATGLHGLLLSPDRGVFVQAPLVWLGVAAWGVAWRCRMRTAAFCGLFALVWTVVHATFWTWHGGWTPGPRFLLPVLPFCLAALPCLLDRWPRWGGGRRLAVVAVVAWGALQAGVQTLVNPLDWNNELWGFLERTESRFLFEPQTSAWRGVWWLLGDGAVHTLWWTGGGAAAGGAGEANGVGAATLGGIGLLSLVWSAVFLATGLLALACGVALARPVRLGRGLGETLGLWRGWVVGPGRAPSAVALILFIAYLIIGLLSGPRGLEREIRLRHPDGTTETRFDLDRRLRWDWPATPAAAVSAPAPPEAPAASSIESISPPSLPPVLERATWEGFLDLPLEGRYVFYLKARGVYTIALDGHILFANDDPAIPQHIPRAEVQLKPGRYPVRIAFAPDAAGGGVLRLFRHWPGEGVLVEPFAAEYLLPRELSWIERTATRVRRGFPLAALLLFCASAIAFTGIYDFRNLRTVRRRDSEEAFPSPPDGNPEERPDALLSGNSPVSSPFGSFPDPPPDSPSESPPAARDGVEDRP